MGSRGTEYGVVHLIVEKSSRLQDYLIEKKQLTTSVIEKLLWLGSIYLNESRVSDKNFQINAGDRLRVHTEPRRFSFDSSLGGRVEKDAAGYLIIDKPSGLPVHALTDNMRENVIELLSQELGIQLFVTHRIDIETSGLLLLAKTKEEQARINSLIRAGKVQRFYHAWVSQEIKPGRYNHYMIRSPKAPKSVSLEPGVDRDICVMNVKSCERVLNFNVNGIDFNAPAFKVGIELETGRTQQIRAQLSELGCPIINDVAYGGVAVDGSVRAISLRAFALELDGSRVELTKF